PLVSRAAAPEEEALQAKPLVSRAAAPEEALQAKPLVSRAAAPEEEKEGVAEPMVSRAAEPEDEVRTKRIARATAPTEETGKDEGKAPTSLATAASFSPTITSDEDKVTPTVQRKPVGSTPPATSSLPLNRSINLPLTAKAQRRPITQRATTKSTPDVLPLALRQTMPKQAARQSISRQQQPGQANEDRENQNVQLLPLAPAVSRSPIAQRQSTTTPTPTIHRDAEESASSQSAATPTSGTAEETLDLDKLARDVYPIIKRMFAIERERSHSRY
ncbi:MAG: hypothetical protein JXA21_29570, partial [Anaerolineae bacterium]|nr:hypothetical protein [Anaerolineae bacterium]